MVYPGHSQRGSGANPVNTGHKAEIHPKWDTSPLQGSVLTHNPTYIHTFIHSYQFSIANLPTSIFLRCGRKLDNPKETHADMCRSCLLRTDINLKSGLNRGFWSGEVEMQSGASLWHGKRRPVKTCH